MLDLLCNTKISVNADSAYGQGLAGTAFRARSPSVSNDFLNDERLRPWHEDGKRFGLGAAAAVPIISNGSSVGILLFYHSDPGSLDDQVIGLMDRIADNISFALENFDRAAEKAKADEQIKYLATHDALTGLPNRAMFNQLLHFSIEAACRHQRQFAVLFIDLDRFKIINDSLGHEAGDNLLVELSGRLRRNLRSSDAVARLGGDEFVVVLEETGDQQAVERVAFTLLSALSQPLQLCGQECNVTASIGIAMYPADGSDAQTLMKNADMAMYLAKEDGKNNFRLFTAKTQSIERLKLETDLRHALDRNQFSLHFQPRVDLVARQITGVEALLHWSHPELGILPALQFMPLAEEIGLSAAIGRWVLNEACRQNMAWQQLGLRPLLMAVNLSPRQFTDVHLSRDIDHALAASGMLPELLQLEITESMVMQNVPRTIKLLDAIRGRGIRLAIDDFGTGYSLMSLMKQFQIDTIKIDRSFVRELSNKSGDRAIAQAIISMSKALGMTVVAEGVETIEQETLLRDHACDEMQGFPFCKPVPANRIPELLLSPKASPPLQPRVSSCLEKPKQSKLKQTGAQA